jgi:hypothetical protein
LRALVLVVPRDEDSLPDSRDFVRFEGAFARFVIEKFDANLVSLVQDVLLSDEKSVGEVLDGITGGNCGT